MINHRHAASGEVEPPDWLIQHDLDPSANQWPIFRRHYDVSHYQKKIVFLDRESVH
jgi:hypothetical protein